MFNLFGKLKEHSLRRLYKFILKRVIGPYLESELLLEQLEVDSGLGLVSIRNLRLNCAVLNQYLKDSPFQLIDAEITELQAAISYNTLLSDGCNLKCQGVKFMVAPQIVSPKEERPNSFLSADRVSSQSSNLSSNTHLREMAGRGGRGDLEDNFADDSVGFIAQWIEVIIARLKISIEDLHVIFLTDHLARTSPALHLTLSNIEFYNSHPRLTKDDGGSVMVASNLYMSHGSVGNSLTKSLIAAMSNRKLITLEGIKMTIIPTILSTSHTLQTLHDLESYPILDMKNGARADIQLYSSSNLTYGSCDLDISIPSFQVELQYTTILLLIQFVTSLDLSHSTSNSSVPSKSKKHSTLITDFSGIGEDIVRLEEGLRRLHLNQTISNLERLAAEDTAENEEIDFPRIAHLLQQYQLTRERLNQTSLVNPSRDETSDYDVDDSGIVFSDDESAYDGPEDENDDEGENDDDEGNDDDEDDYEFDFYDTSEGHQRDVPTTHTRKMTKKMKSSMMQSMYGQNSMSEFQHMFYSTDASHSKTKEAALSRSVEKQRSNAGFFLRLFMDSVSFSYKDNRLSSSANEIQLKTSSLVFSSTISKSTSPSFSLNLAEISLVEKILRNNDQPLINTLVYFKTHDRNENGSVIPLYPLDFHRTNDSNSLSGPQLELVVHMKSVEEGGMHISVHFQHAVCAFSLDSVSRWSTALGEFLAPQTSPSSSIPFSCSILLKSIDVTLKESSENDDRRSQFLSLPPVSVMSNPRWRKISGASPQTQYSGGLRVVFHGISISISSNDNRNSAQSSSMGLFTVAVDEINGFLQLHLPHTHLQQQNVQYETWELGFLSMRSVKDGPKISLSKEKYTGPEGMIKSELEETERLTATDSFDMPVLAISDLIVISAGNVYADLIHHEFLILMATIGLYLSPSPPVVPTSSSSSSMSTPSSTQERVDSNSFGIKICSRSLTLRITEDPEKESVAPLTYIFSIRDPLIEFYNSIMGDVAKQYVGLLATDISLYEMLASETSFISINDFSCKGARVQENYSRVPLLHRTSLEQSWTSNSQRSKHRVLSVRYLSSEELQPESIPSHKSSTLHIALKEMTYRFHPSPVWFTRIPKFFLSSDSTSSSSSSNTISSSSTSPSDLSQRKTTFGQTHLTLSIQKFMIDCCQPHLSNSTQSRLILNVGLLTVNSTLISNTPRVGIKIKISDVSLRLSNKLLQNPQFEQSPLGPNGAYEEEVTELEPKRKLDLDTFYDFHGFVIMCTFDYLECKIDLNSDQRNKYFLGDQQKAPVPVITLEANAGLCNVYGCADSLFVLTNTCRYLSEVLMPTPEEGSPSSEEKNDENEIENENENENKNENETENKKKQSDDRNQLQFKEEKLELPKHKISFHPHPTSVSENKIKHRLIPIVKSPSNNQRSFDDSDEDATYQSPHQQRKLEGFSSPHIEEEQDFSVSTERSLKTSWMKGISEDMFRPRQNVTEPDLERLESISPSEINEEESFQANPVIQGLNEAIIEDYYPGRHNSESPEFEARYFPQYDYDEDEEYGDGDGEGEEGESQLAMSGFLAMDEENVENDSSSVVRKNELSRRFQEDETSTMSGGGGRYGNQYSDSDEDLPDDFEEEKEKKSKQTMPRMWESWGVLKNIGSVPQKHQDIELNSVHSDDDSSQVKENRERILSKPPFETMHMADDRKLAFQYSSQTEEEEEEAEDNASLPISEMDGNREKRIIQVAQGPLDEDMHRAWANHLEDLGNHEVETLAGWYDEAPKFSMLHIPVPSKEDLDTIEDEQSFPRVRVRIVFSLQIRLFSGDEWPAELEKSTSVALPTTSPQEIQRPSLFKESSGQRPPKTLFGTKAVKTITSKNLSTLSGRNSSHATEISLTNVTLHYRTYDSDLKMRSNLPQSSFPALKEQPLRRIVVKVHDLLVSFSPLGSKPKKILGYWKNYPKPIESNKPLLEVTITGFNIPSQKSIDDLEYRLTLSILPLRCYLDGKYIEFVKSFALSFNKLQPEQFLPPPQPSTNSPSFTEGEQTVDNQVTRNNLQNSAVTTSRLEDTNPLDQSNDAALSSPPAVYFQSWQVNVIDLKIDYTPGQLDLQSLQMGDYTQLLNIFTIDGLEITLTKVRLSGVSGISTGVQKCLEEWVNEIYAHQMHRLISGASPLRGLSNIGANIHGLVMIPVQEYKKKGAAGVLRALQRQSVSLFKTITRETLHASHKVSHFIANSLVELVSPERFAKFLTNLPLLSSLSSALNQSCSTNTSRHQIHDHSANKQPVGFIDSLDLAYNAMSREIHSTLDTVVVMPVRQYSRSGPGGYVRSVIRALPVAILRPTAGAAEALSYTLLGLRNNIDPSSRRDEEDMWEVNHSRGNRRNAK